MDELGSAELVGDIQVEPRIMPRGIRVERLRHGYIGGWVLDPQPEVVEADAVPLQMLPDRARLSDSLGQYRRIPARERQPAGSLGRPEVLLLIAPRGDQRRLGPGIRIRARQPVVPAGA